MDFWKEHAKRLTKTMRAHPELTLDFIRTASLEELANVGLPDFPLDARARESVIQSQTLNHH